MVAKNLAHWNVVTAIWMLRAKLQNEKLIQGTLIFATSVNFPRYTKLLAKYNFCVLIISNLLQTKNCPCKLTLHRLQCQYSWLLQYEKTFPGVAARIPQADSTNGLWHQEPRHRCSIACHQLLQQYRPTQTCFVQDPVTAFSREICSFYFK